MTLAAQTHETSTLPENCSAAPRCDAAVSNDDQPLEAPKTGNHCSPSRRQCQTKTLSVPSVATHVASLTSQSPTYTSVRHNLQVQAQRADTPKHDASVSSSISDAAKLTKECFVSAAGQITPAAERGTQGSLPALPAPFLLEPLSKNLAATSDATVASGTFTQRPSPLPPSSVPTTDVSSGAPLTQKPSVSTGAAVTKIFSSVTLSTTPSAVVSHPITSAPECVPPKIGVALTADRKTHLEQVASKALAPSRLSSTSADPLNTTMFSQETLSINAPHEVIPAPAEKTPAVNVTVRPQPVFAASVANPEATATVVPTSHNTHPEALDITGNNTTSQQLPAESVMPTAQSVAPAKESLAKAPALAAVVPSLMPTTVAPPAVPTASTSHHVLPNTSKRMPRLQAVVRRIGSTLAAASGAKSSTSKREAKPEKDFLKAYLKKFDADEVEVLRKVYKELSARNPGPGIDKETFLQYFPLPGLWGERLFQRFDYKCLGAVDYEEFLVGIAVCCRGTKCERVHVLFQVFDLNGDGVLQKEELVAMLSNLPNLDRYVRKQSPVGAPRNKQSVSRSNSFVASAHSHRSPGPVTTTREDTANSTIEDSIRKQSCVCSINNCAANVKPPITDTAVAEEYSSLRSHKDFFQLDDYGEEDDDEGIEDGDDEDCFDRTAVFSDDHVFPKLHQSLFELDNGDTQCTTTDDEGESMLDYVFPSITGPFGGSAYSNYKVAEVSDEQAQQPSESKRTQIKDDASGDLKAANTQLKCLTRRELAYSSNTSTNRREGHHSDEANVLDETSVNINDAIDVEAFVDKIIEECEFSDSDALTYMEFKTWLERNDAILALFTECLHEEVWGLQGNALYRRSGYCPSQQNEKKLTYGKQLQPLDPSRSHGVERRKRGVVEVRPDSFYKVKRLFTVSARSTFSALVECQQQRKLQLQQQLKLPVGGLGADRHVDESIQQSSVCKNTAPSKPLPSLNVPGYRALSPRGGSGKPNEEAPQNFTSGIINGLSADAVAEQRLRPPAVSDMDMICPRQTREVLNVQLLDLIMTANPHMDATTLLDEINSGSLDDEDSLICCPSCHGLLVVCPRCHRRLPSLQLSHGVVLVECHSCLEDKPYQFHTCWHCHWDFAKASELVDQCEPLYEGVLYKIGKHTHKWRRRYFVLVDNLLYYYARKEDTKPRGFFFLEGCFVEALGGNKNGGHATTASAGYAIPPLLNWNARGEHAAPPPMLGGFYDGKVNDTSRISPVHSVAAAPGDPNCAGHTAPSAEADVSSRRTVAGDGRGVGATTGALRFPKFIGPTLGVSTTSGSGGTYGGKYGFSIIHGVGKIPRRDLYANTAEEREMWMKALRRAMNQQLVDELYTLDAVVGQGKFSMVYLGLTRDSRRRPEKVAIKVIEKSKMNSHERELLRSEVVILRLLRHPHVISLREILDSRTHIYIVMEFVEGGELYDLIQLKRKLPESHVNRIIFQLLSTVAYLHKCGIIHRDLKPENILLTDSAASDDADIKITDFGLSCICGPEELVTQPCGTLAYVAPEVLTLQGYCHKVDVWSVGVIMFLLLRGRLPFPVTPSRATHQPHQPTAPPSSQNQPPPATGADSSSRPATSHYSIPSRYTTALNFDGPVWNGVSSSAKDLLRKLLQPYPEKRISAQEALEHIWIKNPTAVINEAASDVEPSTVAAPIQVQKIPCNQAAQAAARFKQDSDVPVPGDFRTPTSVASSLPPTRVDASVGSNVAFTSVAGKGVQRHTTAISVEPLRRSQTMTGAPATAHRLHPWEPEAQNPSHQARERFLSETTVFLQEHLLEYDKSLSVILSGPSLGTLSHKSFPPTTEASNPASSSSLPPQEQHVIEHSETTSDLLLDVTAASFSTMPHPPAAS